MIARWQLNGLVALAFVFGLFGLRTKLLSEGEARMRGKIAERQLNAAKHAQEVRNEVESLDRDTLRGRGAVWVRGTKPKR